MTAPNEQGDFPGEIPGGESGGATPPQSPSGGGSSDDALIAAALAQALKVPSGSAAGRGDLAIAPDLIPGYTITREIHRGGQGVVYQALQKSTKRKVAVKVMREGPFAGARERQRFEREVEILGSLNHPNIVAVIDSGSAGGMFYFVMDYIDGQPLDVWLSASRRTTEDVIRLFEKIGEAVNAAHLKGVIHRDLKPGNIRVDDKNQPHILDFGLAKAGIDASNPDPVTVTGQFLGSLPWASPEQADGVPSRIDVRTDVYSLGVMLYQALTGRFPYEVVGNMADILRNIRSVTPERPSSIRRQIGNEVETIVLKCLSKDRERRYQSAGDLARDLNRFLNGEPIEAKRDSGWYVVTKTLSRHRLVLLAGAAVLTALVVGGVVSAVFWRRAEADRRQVSALLDQTNRAMATVSAYATFVDEMLSGIDPDQAKGRDTSLLMSILGEASARAERSLANDPLAQASVRETLGRAYTRIGQFDAAKGHLEWSLAKRRELLGNTHPGVARVLSAIAALAQASGRPADSIAPAEEARDIAVNFARAQGRADGISPDSVAAMLLVAQGKKMTGDVAAAENEYEAVIDALTALGGPGNAAVAEPMSSLGRLYYEQRRYTEAAEVLERALTSARSAWGEESIPVTTVKNTLASVFRDRDGPTDLARAATLVAEVVRAHRATLPPNHPLLAESLSRQGLLLRHLDRLGEARESLSESIGVWRSAAGLPASVRIEDIPDDRLTHPTAISACQNMSLVLRDAGDLPAARFWQDRVLRLSSESSPARARHELHDAELRRLEGDARGAVAAAERLLERRRAQKQEGSVDWAEHLLLLSRARRDAKDAEGAASAAREALTIYDANAGGDSLPAALAAGTLADALAELGRGGEAASLAERRLRALRALRGDDHRLTRQAQESLDRIRRP